MPFENGPGVNGAAQILFALAGVITAVKGLIDILKKRRDRKEEKEKEDSNEKSY